MKGSKYPRPGSRLSPVTLRPLLRVSLPAKFQSQRYSTLADLDEGAWTRFSSETCLALGFLIVKRIASLLSVLPATVGARHLPRVPEDVTLEQLELKTRTHNCVDRLIRWGAIKNVRGLSGFTVRDAIRIKGLGAKGLVDLLVALECAEERTREFGPLFEKADRDGVSQGVLLNRLTLEAKKLSKLKCSGLIRVDDPRLRKFVAPVHADLKRILNRHDRGMLSTLRHCADAIAKRACEIENAEIHAQNLHQVRGQLQKMRRASLEEELKELVFSVSRDRTATMVLRMQGWDGRGGATLQQVGDEGGCTRERVRQVCTPVTDRLARSYIFLPILDRALSVTHSSVPLLAKDLETKLQSKGICKTAFRLEGLIAATEVLDRRIEFEIVEIGSVRVAIPLGNQELGKTIVHLAKRAVEHWGTSTIENVVDQVNARKASTVSTEFVVSLLRASEDFVWLDENHGGWFWLRSVPRNRILNQVFKILSVAPRIRLSELRTGVSRHYKLEGFAPPRRVLAELCRHQPGMEVDGEFVVAITPLDPNEVLSGAEATLTKILVDKGPIMRRVDFEEMSVNAWLTSAAFYMHLSNSPILAKYAVGVYGLRGAQAEPGVVEALAPRMKPGKVLSDFGWTKDGRIWLRFELSSSMILTGNLTIPASMRNMIAGEFILKTQDGTETGRIGARDGRGWRLGPVLRRSGGEPGDRLLLTFDLHARDVVMNFGDESELDDAELRSGDVLDLPCYRNDGI